MLPGIPATLAHAVFVALPIEAVALAVLFKAARLLTTAALIAFESFECCIVNWLAVGEGSISQFDGFHRC